MSEIDLYLTCLPPYRLLRLHGSQDSIKEMLDLRGMEDERERRAPIAGPRAFSISPTDWLLVDHSLTDARRRFFSRTTRRSQIQVTDVSQALATILVEGRRARSVLAATTDAPELLKAATPRQYAGVRLGEVDVIVQCIHAQGFELYADRRAVDYLKEWIRAVDDGKGTSSSPRQTQLN